MYGCWAKNNGASVFFHFKCHLFFKFFSEMANLASEGRAEAYKIDFALSKYTTKTSVTARLHVLE